MKIFFSFLLLLTTVYASAQGVTVESVALFIARQHNEKMLHDDMTVASTAQAIGKNVRVTNIIRVQRGLSQAKRNEFQIATYSEIVPNVCRVSLEDPAFTRGLYYTFIYFNTYGEKLAEFIVNRRACGRG